LAFLVTDDLVQMDELSMYPGSQQLPLGAVRAEGKRGEIGEYRTGAPDTMFTVASRGRIYVFKLEYMMDVVKRRQHIQGLSFAGTPP
jgi:hypothetical protein